MDLFGDIFIEQYSTVYMQYSTVLLFTVLQYPSTGKLGAMRPQRNIIMIKTTHSFVKLKQIKAAVSAGGIKFNCKMFDVELI